MNLQEQIIRIQEMMGVDDSLELTFKRRFHELPDFVSSTIQWLNPKAFKSLGEFLERVIFATTRDFVGDFGISDHKKLLELREQMEKHVRNYIIENHLEEIKEYYNKEEH